MPQKGPAAKAKQTKAPTEAASAAGKPATPPETPSSQEQDRSDDGELQLLTLVANRLLLKGKAKIDKGASIEVDFADLPEETQRQIQELINEKLSLKPRPGRNKNT